MYDTRYTDKVDTSQLDTGTLKVSNKVNKGIQTDIPISVEVSIVNKVKENTEDKPRTSKRKLSPEGISTTEGVEPNILFFKILRTDLIVDFEGNNVNKKFIIKEINFFNYYLNSFNNLYYNKSLKKRVKNQL